MIQTKHVNAGSVVVQPHVGAAAARATNDRREWVELSVNEDGTFEIHCSSPTAIRLGASNEFELEVGL